MKDKSTIAGFITLVSLLVIAGCAPESFAPGRNTGWKTVALSDGLMHNYDTSWQKTVDTIARDYDIEMMDKDSGYLRTSWLYGISGGDHERYRGRIIIKYPEVKEPEKVEIKTDAQWLLDPSRNVWQRGWDTSFNQDVVTILTGRLGRTVAPDRFISNDKRSGFLFSKK